MRKTTLGKIAPNITSGSRGWASYYSDEGALFLRMTNLPKSGIGLLLHDNKYVNLPEGSSEGTRTRVRVNDILISITAELGKIGFIHSDLGEAYVNQHVALVHVKDPNTDSRYLAYYLASQPERNRLNRLNDSGAKAGLSLQTINKFPVLLPPLPEQKAIADLLSTWDEAIEKTERLIQAKERRFRWLLRELISEPKNTEKNDGWNEVKLGQICKVTKGKQLNVAHMKDDGAYYALNGGISPSGRTDDWNTEAETITISEGGNSCGYVNYNTERFWSGGHCYSLLSLKETVDKHYLYFYLKMNEPKLMKLRVGSGLPNIQKKDVDKFVVALPSLAKQQQIAQSLSSTRREIDILRQLAEKYTTQKHGLMQKVLTGEWRVKPEIVNQYREA